MEKAGPEPPSPPRSPSRAGRGPAGSRQGWPAAGVGTSGPALARPAPGGQRGTGGPTPGVGTSGRRVAGGDGRGRVGLREKWLYFSYTLHDGARYHTSASTQAFLAAHSERITEHPLPLYSPDYNPIEFLWRKTKKRATYNKYFKEFAAVVVSADKALAYFAAHPEMVLELLGFTVKRALSNSSRLRRFRKQT